MIEHPLILDGGESIDQLILDQNRNDVEMNAGTDEGECMDDYKPSHDLDNDDFELDGFNHFSLPDNKGENDEKGCDPEYNGTITGQKRKRACLVFSQSTTVPLQRSSVHSKVDSAEAFILDEDNVLPNKQSSRVPGTFGRRNRRKGESLPAYHKRVSHELDSDDELMMQMRDKGFSDRQIADKLAKDGRVRYDQKSISTRIMRIRLAQAENIDFLLKEGYKEWEFKDDCLLMQAHALADIEISYEIERIRAWRFRKVSDYMRRLDKNVLFSATACRERYCALMEGTASIPSEMDDDPESRRASMEAYRKSREQIRNKEQEERDAKEVAEEQAKEEARIRNAQKAEEIANKRVARATEKAQRALTRAAKAQLRAQQSLENQIAKAQRNTQIKKQKTENAAKKAKGTHAPDHNITVDMSDPRDYLSLHDLGSLCIDRGIQVFERASGNVPLQGPGCRRQQDGAKVSSGPGCCTGMQVFRCWSRGCGCR